MARSGILGKGDAVFSIQSPLEIIKNVKTFFLSTNTAAGLLQNGSPFLVGQFKWKKYFTPYLIESKVCFK